jgi:hypothetical protein
MYIDKEVFSMQYHIESLMKKADFQIIFEAQGASCKIMLDILKIESKKIWISF